MQPDMSGAAPAPGTEGFLTHIRQLGASLVGHVAMRVELLSIEVQEEKARLVKLAMSAAIVSALLMVSMVMMSILVLAIYWDTPYRVTAAIWLVALFSAGTVGAGFYLYAQLQQSSTLFANSAAELRLDADAMAPRAPLTAAGTSS
jgi:uncharacterized membrane protein YqjE